MSETGESILNAAMMLFAEKGFSGTTTRQIAQQAGVNEVTLFRHFRSKTELFHRILEEIQRLYPPLLALDQVGESSPEDVLIEYSPESSPGPTTRTRLVSANARGATS